MQEASAEEDSSGSEKQSWRKAPQVDMLGQGDLTHHVTYVLILFPTRRVCFWLVFNETGQVGAQRHGGGLILRGNCP